jgi:hypothetical protein
MEVVLIQVFLGSNIGVVEQIALDDKPHRNGTSCGDAETA